MDDFTKYINEIRRRAGLPPLVEMQLNETMDFSPIKLSPPTEDFPKGLWQSAFPRKWTEWELIPRDGSMDWERYHRDDEFRKSFRNPDFREDLEVNLSNYNMEYIMGEVLGFPGNSRDGFHIPIDKFLMIARTWLAEHRGMKTPEVPSYEEEPWEDWEDPEMKRGWTARPGSNVVQMQPKTEPRRGARVIQGGRREGYDEETIERMVEIAALGKEHGATHVSAH